jgi:hypothetical protein
MSTSGPLAIVTLERDQAGSPALCCDSGALFNHVLFGSVDQVAHHLPPDRRIRVE